MDFQQVAEATTTTTPPSPAALAEMLNKVEQHNAALDAAKVPPELAQGIVSLQAQISDMIERLNGLTVQATEFGIAKQAAESAAAAAGQGMDFLVVGLTVFALAVFVGYHVVWRVTPALHSPLMSVTNAISSVIVVGALIAAGPAKFNLSTFMGFLAVVLASVNIFGGFIVSQRMLAMFKKKK